MTIHDIRQKYFDFMQARGHQIIPSSSLVPEGDATTLFTSAGMQPMMPYLLGQKHPLGARLADSQKCFRSQDIDEVGDNRHTTFFEMLGNWSLGDYFKKEQLKYFFTFLTDKKVGLGLDPHRLSVSVFAGGSGVDKDEEAIQIWQNLFATVGIQAKEGVHIFPYPAKKNWWSRSGTPDQMPTGEPGGPDSEVFFDFGVENKLHELSPWKDEPCHINCDCGRFMEIGNSVFMQYVKQADGSLKELPQKNIDFGGGLTRLEAAVRDDPDMFNISSLAPVIQEIEKLSEHSYSVEEHRSSMRIIADHLTAGSFLIKDGVFPSNKGQGYVLRRLLRRAAIKLYFLTSDRESILKLPEIVRVITDFYAHPYFDPQDYPSIQHTITTEISKFSHSLDRGLKELEKNPQVDGKFAFDLYQNYGFPLEITAEILAQMGKQVDLKEFQAEFEKHKELSRTSSAGMFKGGLADKSQVVTAYHTATHLLHASLRRILGNRVEQKGSNITADRLRFDFSYTEKITDEQIKAIEDLINKKIAEKLSVVREEMPKEDALKQGALAFFGQKYPEIVSVYTIGPKNNFFSKELCGGPHVESLAELAKINIVKQESLGATTRRLYLQFV
ncbi:MAG: alanyl-tRNA synthetase [Candidatus Collierbacteria bacterium GW2011_GWB1_44_6]|uniref:alanine--tRNA ligase n=1 Tax=Candidatus Collierbacteria bacterium GW2011_GWB1_44_6 TaxID=1618384 RepID=A0A0G1JNU8_9BACT|nr:MAG: alanyl-tRNA synthetase [Candidatus Collierbacteria bacterium GW2011_GWB1_44_6]